jgi:hypothetical protein
MRLSGFAVAITVLLVSSDWSQERAGQVAPLIVGTWKLNTERSTLIAAGLALSIVKRVPGSVDVILVDHVEQPTEN